MWVASGLETAKPSLFNGSKDKTLRTGHTCYAHLVGTLSVAIAPALVEGGHAKLSDENGLIMESLSAVISQLSIDIKVRAAKPMAKVFCAACLDWSESHPHLARKINGDLCAKGF